MVSRRNPNDLDSVEKQIIDISLSLKLQGKKEIILVDDGSLKENTVAHWIESNDWACKEIAVMDEDAAKWLVLQTKQAVLIIG